MYKNWILCLYITLLYIPFSVHAASLPEENLIDEPATEELNSHNPEEKSKFEQFQESIFVNTLDPNLDNTDIIEIS